MIESPLHPNTHITSLSVETLSGVPTQITAKTPDKSITLQPVHQTASEDLHEIFSTAIDRAFAYCGWEPLPTLEDVQEYQSERASVWGERFEYMIRVGGVPAGVTYLKESDGDNTCFFGLWLHDEYWGRGLSGIRADITLHLAFHYFDFDAVTVGCLDANQNSRRAIEKYTHRYNGTYYGAPLVKWSNYSDDKTGFTPHHEYIITRADFDTHATGLDCSVPGLSYSDISFE